MKRVPIFPTLVVVAAAAVMVALGFWQLDRAKEKEALLAQLAVNIGAPPLPAGELTVVDPKRDLFRRDTVHCAPPVRTWLEGAGSLGFRVLAECSSGEPHDIVQLGTTRSAAPAPPWSGGDVEGFWTLAPSKHSLLHKMFYSSDEELMTVANPPVAGLRPNPRPNLEDIPNNHRSYAVQWFSFAAIALIIYGLALRRRAA